MTDRSRMDRVLSFVLALSAIVVAGSVVYRTFGPDQPVTRRAPDAPPTLVADSLWHTAIELGRPFLGSASASATIIEFTDLECPACRGFHPRLDSVARETPGVRVLYIPHPLPYHRFAKPAANAAECAADSGALSAWVNVVFQKQDSLGLKSWGSYAAEAGIRDTARIATCARSAETAERVQRGLSLGEAMGLTGTPFVIVNRLAFGSTPSRQQLEDALALPAGRTTARSASKQVLVEGRVLAEPGMAPIVGAEIVLQDSAGRVRSRAVSDSSGGYRIHTTAGRYRIRCAAKGYTSFVGRLNELEGELPPHVLILEPEGTGSR